MLSRVSAFFGTTGGFAALNVSMVIWLPIGWWMGWSSQWLLLFTVYLSVLAIETTGVVLVGQRVAEKRMTAREAALQAKTNEIVRAVPDADNSLIGCEEEDTPS